MVTKVASDRQGIQSIEVGFRLLSVLAATNRPMMLRDIAKGASMPAAKAHRYMVSFLRIGIVEQDAGSGRYDLGAYALELGLSGLGRLDPVRLSGPILEALCEEIQETVALAVWGNRGSMKNYTRSPNPAKPLLQQYDASWKNHLQKFVLVALGGQRGV